MGDLYFAGGHRVNKNQLGKRKKGGNTDGHRPKLAFSSSDSTRVP